MSGERRIDLLAATRGDPMGAFIRELRDIKRRLAAVERAGYKRGKADPIDLSVVGATVDATPIVEEAVVESAAAYEAAVNWPLVSGARRRVTGTATALVYDAFFVCAGTFALTLPTAAQLSALNGKLLIITVESGTVTVTAGTGTTINGAASVAITTSSDGFIWYDAANTDWTY